jgi:hypothetical protein
LYATSRIMPTHPQCRCCMVPETKSWAEITGDPSLDDTRPVIEGGEVLFSRLTEEEQIAVLGAQGHELYTEGAPLSAWAIERHDDRWGPTLTAASLAQVVREDALQPVGAL